MALRYVCPGNCGGAVSEEEFVSGKTTCMTPTCSRAGAMLEKRMVCEACHVPFDPAKPHACGTE